MALTEETQQLWTLNEFAGHTIRMRNSDGYLCATDMVKINKKEWKHYKENKQSQEFIEALSGEVGIPTAELIESITKNCEFRGTWVHPKIAIHLAMWISPTFSVKVIDWVHRFLNGDISLVKDIVDRHDEINNTKSEVLITTMNNQLEEYNKQIKNLENSNQQLENIKDELKTQIDKINQFTCSYCNRRYSSTAGLTRHYKNCTDKKMCEFKAVLNFEKFLKYVELLSEYELESIDITLNDISTDKPILVLTKYGKTYKYNIYLNNSRWKIVKVLEKYIDLPLELLLEESSLNMFQENKAYYKTIYKSLDSEVDFCLEEEFKEKLGLGLDSEDL